MNFNLEKNFPTFINKAETKNKKQSQKEYLKSLGKKAAPYIAAIVALLSSPTFLKAQEKLKDNTKVEYKLTSPDGKQTKTFNTKEERDAFARAHNLNIPSDRIGNQKDTPIQKVETNSEKVEWKLVSPDGKQTKTFNTKEERDAFAKAKGINLPESSTREEQKKSKTVNYQDFINSAPTGKSEIIQIDANNDAKIYKVKKGEKRIKIKEGGSVQVIRTEN